ncbi:MAG TPA: hypothetical protein VHG27_09115 [Xanthobacteraceae bacterium]|nr:hypothetical protein [Xanthobacteraceae bacterium]
MTFVIMARGVYIRCMTGVKGKASLAPAIRPKRQITPAAQVPFSAGLVL